MCAALRYAAVDSSAAAGRNDDPARWCTRSTGSPSRRTRVTTTRTSCPMARARSRCSATTGLPARCATDWPTPATRRPLSPRRVTSSMSPNPAPARADVDCAVRLSLELADLVRGLAERDDDHPVTLWIVTRGVREGSSDAAVRAEPDVGNRRGHPGRAAAVVGRPGRPAGRRGHRRSRTGAVHGSADTGEVDSGAARRRILGTGPGAGVRRAGARAAAVPPGRGIPDHRWHGCARSADGRLARGSRCASGDPGRPYRAAAPPRLGQRHQRRRHHAEDQRHPGARDARGRRRSRGARHRFARGDAGSAGQTRRRRGRADTRRHPRRRYHRRPTVHRARGGPSAAHHVAEDRRRAGAAPDLPARQPRLLVPDGRGRCGVRCPRPGRLRGGQRLPRRFGPGASPAGLPHRQPGLGGLARTRLRRRRADRAAGTRAAGLAGRSPPRKPSRPGTTSSATTSRRP